MKKKKFIVMNKITLTHTVNTWNKKSVIDFYFTKFSFLNFWIGINVDLCLLIKSF